MLLHLAGRHRRRPWILAALWLLLCSPAGAQGDPALVGQWSAVQAWPAPGIHTHLLPTGKVMFHSLVDDPRAWDPATGAITPLATAGFNIFCSGHSLLPDGRLLFTGGHVLSGVGLPFASVYDPATNSWQRTLDLNAARWYPTNTTLANGDVLVISGNIDNLLGVNLTPQVWQIKTDTWRLLTGAPLSLPLYPFMYQAPNGKVFNAGPNQITRYIDTAGTGAWTTVASSNFGYRPEGSSAMYDDGKVLIVGGHDPPTATAEVIDLNAASPAWRYVGAMALPRRHLNATLLPDGTVLVTGGSSGAGWDNAAAPALSAELWNPATEGWTTLAGCARYRGYHSTALLLPDGRVLVSGGDAESNAEIFSPPYLFRGARPTIGAAPASVTYGQTFAVPTPDAAAIAGVTWVRLSSVTHAFNENQRINRLRFTRGAGVVNVTAPSSARLCPPGHYLLFLLNNNGVPSVAPIQRIDLPPLPGVPANLTALPGNAQVRLAWAAATNATSYNVKRAATSGGPYATIATGVTATGYTDTGLANGTTYYYVVSAVNAAGESANSNQASATPQAPPPAPTNLTATAGNAQVSLSWTASAGAASYNVKRSTTSGGPYATIAAGVAATGYTDIGLINGTTYYYVVSAVSAGGEGPNSNQASATPLPAAPAAPTNLTATAGNAQIALAWTAAGGATGYHVKRSNTSGGPYSIVATGVTATGYTDVGLANGTTYYYVVSAINAGGESANSNQAAATPQAPPPAAPTNLTATAGNAQVSLSWTASAGAASYNVKRSGTSGGPYTVIAAGVTSTTYTDTGLANGTTYYYVVSAVGAGGESANSNQAAATPQIPLTGSGTITREYWTGVSGTAVSAIPVGSPPSGTQTLTSLEGPTNAGDNYGARIRGYLTAPATGSYTFWIAGDDNSELYLSTNDQPAGKARIASVSGWTYPREWNKYATQKSAARTLTAGVRYYIEVLHKEGTLGDHVAVGWLQPGQTGSAPSEVIPGLQLSPYAAPPGPPPGGTTLRINSGGGAYTSPTLGAFGADAYFSGGATWDYGNLDFANTSDDRLIATIRYSTGSFRYVLPASAGAYTLKLYFATGNSPETVDHLFHVSVNGTRVLSNFNIITAAGGANRLVVQSIPVTLSSAGNVSVVFETVRDAAGVSALELIPASP